MVVDHYSLDACALFALLRGEAGHEVIASALQGSGCSTHVINLFEVYVWFLKNSDEAQADAALQAIDLLNVAVETDLDVDLIKDAARLRSGFQMSVPDAIGLAYCARRGCAFLTSDGELAALKDSGAIPIHFFRPPNRRVRRADQIRQALQSARERTARLEFELRSAEGPE